VRCIIAGDVVSGVVASGGGFAFTDLGRRRMAESLKLPDVDELKLDFVGINCDPDELDATAWSLLLEDPYK
jgi:hypothetical protein